MSTSLADYEFDDDDDELVADQRLVQAQNEQLFKQHVYCELFAALRKRKPRVARIRLSFKDNALVSRSQMSVAIDDVIADLRRLGVACECTSRSDGSKAAFWFSNVQHALQIMRRLSFVVDWEMLAD
jgi:hypothetical protein